jgi:hypothetical protein
VLLCLAAILLLWLGLIRSPPASTSSGPDAQAFADGMGIYLLNDGKYSLLIWKKKLVGPPAPPEERDLVEAMQQASVIKKNAQFFAYGMDMRYFSNSTAQQLS